MDQLASRRALNFLNEGMRAAKDGQVAAARDLFRRSAEQWPSADAFTYWAWMEHHAGQTFVAIRLCKMAIQLDPEFGNPYNDIGSYLIALGDTESAIEWLEKAIASTRYEPRQFPHINLGRIYLSKGQPRKAIEHFRKALEYAPEDPEILRTIEKIMNGLQ